MLAIPASRKKALRYKENYFVCFGSYTREMGGFLLGFDDAILAHGVPIWRRYG